MMLPALVLFTVLTSVISGVTGMGGGIVLLSVMTFLLDFHIIVPIHGIVQLTSNFSRSLLLIKHVRKEYFLYFALGTPFGTALAFYALRSIRHEKYLLIPLIILISYSLFKPKKLPPLKVEKKGFFLLGLIASTMSPLIGATGPLLAPFFLRDDFTKEEIVATKAATQTFTHLLKIPLFISLSFNYQNYALIIITMAAAAIVGTKIGTFLLGKISTHYFKLIYKGAMLLALCRLLYKYFN